jgi:hypothetical protein
MWERKNQPKLFIKNNYIHQADGAPEPRMTWFKVYRGWID